MSKVTVRSIKNIFDITDEIRGNESPNPTPAPQIMAPINKTSNINLLNEFFAPRIPEKVKFVSGFSVNAIPKATAGKQYIAHAENPQ